MRFHFKSQNQLVIVGVTHKLYIHAQTFQFYQRETNFTFTFQHAPSLVAINKVLHVHTIFNQTGTVENQDRALCSDTILNFSYINWVLIKQVMHINSNEVPS